MISLIQSENASSDAKARIIALGWQLRIRALPLLLSLIIMLEDDVAMLALMFC
ncbi:hypothetical protein RGU70_15465 [Herbaspirillum sp. RTI4]|uniref:hypothetical protein n=1 Tax=Herbaspirillum sp. RTI4 TaxID=3048640 RepID=UPI002AB3E9EB|nr:hypothetical protein [Herbaspirillum sp. RTI4]MDY7579712.1 hypothetical protein [Herbaspirillum sp. RTI4]MEA9983039.1 hypothetical protein [Herbaspirillum sp. RTI4]